MSAQVTERHIRQRRYDWHQTGSLAALTIIVLAFLWLMTFYGDALPPPYDDEVFFVQPAQNLAEGKGMGTPVLDELIPGIAKRTYWQPPFYFLTLSLWGRVFGFDLLSARWFSRLAGVLGLVVIFGLARCWGLPIGVSLLCVLWVASDLVYQYRANFARMDMLNALLVFSALWLFTVGIERSDNHRLGLSGTLTAAATLTHLISVPIAFALVGTLMVRRRWHSLLWFALPIAIGWAIWLIYVVQDFQSFLAQMAIQFAGKGHGISWVVADQFRRIQEWLLMTRWMDFWGALLTNEPPWFGIIIVLTFTFICRCLPMALWQLGIVIVAYGAAVIACGGGLHYLPLFVPLGYVATTRLGVELAKKPMSRLLLLICVVIWCGCQLSRITQTIVALPTYRASVQSFLKGLERTLPPGATIIIASFPDPYFHLQTTRPDLTVYEMLPISQLWGEEALAKLLRRSDFYLWGGMEGLPFLPVEQRRYEWTIQAPLKSYRIYLAPLRKDINKGRWGR